MTDAGLVSIAAALDRASYRLARAIIVAAATFKYTYASEGIEFARAELAKLPLPQPDQSPSPPESR